MNLPATLATTSLWDRIPALRTTPDKANARVAAIFSFPEDASQIRIHRESINGDAASTRTCQSKNPLGLLASCAEPIIGNIQQVTPNRETLGQLKTDIDTVLGKSLGNAFQQHFDPHMVKNRAVTKQELVNFFNDHDIIHVFQPPVPAEADLQPEERLPVDAELHTEPSPEAEPLPEVLPEELPEASSYPTYAAPINDQTDPNFGHDHF
jgi:hypothetical protein